MIGRRNVGTWTRFLFGSFLFLGVMLLASRVEAQVCTDISPIPFISDLNCASAPVCDTLTVGSPCNAGSGKVCTPFARRFNAVCCTCETPGALAKASLKCVEQQRAAEAKFVACHVKETAKAARKGEAPDYAKCAEQLMRKAQKIADKFGNACPGASLVGPSPSDVMDNANTYAALLGDVGANAASVLICGPDSNWDPNTQTCVTMCRP